MTTTTT